MELKTLPFQVFLLNVTQTAGVQVEEGAGTHRSSHHTCSIFCTSLKTRFFYFENSLCVWLPVLLICSVQADVQICFH